jgi:hypothetical protein
MEQSVRDVMTGSATAVTGDASLADVGRLDALPRRGSWGLAQRPFGLTSVLAMLQFRDFPSHRLRHGIRVWRVRRLRPKVWRRLRSIRQYQSVPRPSTSGWR